MSSLDLDKAPNAGLRGWLAERKVSYVQLSIRTGIPLNTIKDKMRGKRDWKQSEIIKILDFTNESFDNLFR